MLGGSTRQIKRKNRGVGALLPSGNVDQRKNGELPVGFRREGKSREEELVVRGAPGLLS